MLGVPLETPDVRSLSASDYAALKQRMRQHAAATARQERDDQSLARIAKRFSK